MNWVIESAWKKKTQEAKPWSNSTNGASKSCDCIKNAIKIMKIVELTVLSYPTVRTTIDLFETGGWTAIRPSRRGRPRGDGRVLSPAREDTIQRPKREGAEIHWGDETALTNTDVRGRSYAPAGKTPVALAVGGTRQKLSIIATVTNQSKTRWMIIEEAFDADKFIEFLQALIKDAGNKVFLILDNLRVHHSKQVKAWVAERKEQIELFYLPS
jgi:DDE superfamily endonuclease/Winged helix-turn helix